MAQVASGFGGVWRWVAAVAALVLTAAAIGLWARHGAAVFFDMLATGIAYCF
ncbi:hypothetical protein KHC23_01890 [Ancylobacter dichloromethanicus]|nr:hypothetical protein [Ancylobacter dichloromethanicus]MBS7552410.1 hypothetical protein [Ancylobacter dichloromethanicus]